ncbi:MAG TPA: penicillin-binding protein 2 [Bacteroidota bacterium]|nr:penicillin-binding protein 2 [Bacteroidota bacterium]
MDENLEITKRRNTFYIGLVLLFVVFLGRLAQLQLLYQDVYGKKSEENSIRQIVRDPLRGNIYDRNGKLIVDNRPSYTVTITPAEFHTQTIPYLSDILSLDPELILERFKKGKLYNRFTPIKIKRDIDFRTLSILEENRGKLAGVDYLIETKRFYPTDARAPHLFGYTNEVSDLQLSEMPDEYRLGDVIGATGLEARYERVLRGRKGFDFITVNARGQMLGPFNEGRSDIQSREGNDLFLALDADLQAFAESLLNGKQGAIVAIDPQDGGVLALASKPDFDLSLFGSVTPHDLWSALNNDPSKPLFNRATMTRYPPGSTFKMVLATSALQEGVINTSWSINCKGAFQFGNKVFKDLHVHGPTNIVEAIQRSCNVFFYQLMLKNGFERWTRYGKELGFGSPTGIDLFEENSGLLPSGEFFDRIYGEGKWTEGYLISLAIGQGEVGVSPLQMACHVATFSNNGIYYTPRVVQKILEKETGASHSLPIQARKLNISPHTLSIIRDGMYRCVNVLGGTGSAAKIQGVTVAGKTGTAQNPHGKDHSWFIGFAPFERPQIAICVLIENAGFGGAIAAPIAGLCMEKYLFRSLLQYKEAAPIANKENTSLKNIQ